MESMSNLPPSYATAMGDKLYLPVSSIAEKSLINSVYDNHIVKSLLQVVLGLTLGTLIDQIVSKIKSKDAQKGSAWGRIIVQIFVNSAVILSAQMFFPWLADEWINTNAGMLFAAFFFSVQSGFYRDWDEQVHALW